MCVQETEVRKLPKARKRTTLVKNGAFYLPAKLEHFRFSGTRERVQKAWPREWKISVTR